MYLRRMALLAVGVALVLSAPAWAQNVNSRLTGTARDAQGAVLPGVTVTATSPSLIGTQVAVTEANGTYLFPSLSSGTYTLKFELQGFQAYTRQNIVLSLGQTLTVDGQLQVASLKENVTVTAESPVVDTQSTAVGSTLDTAKLIGVPSSSDLWGALAQAPGVHMGAFDVGGSHKSQQSGYSSFGLSGQNRVVTEGVDTTEGSSGAGFYQDYFSQNEIAVSGAGQDVSMNTPGAAVVSTIKSGGNTFKSLINQTYEGSSFVGNNVDPNGEIAKRGGSAQPNLIFWENHDDLGGPIMKDKLWFFVAYNHFKIDKKISGVDPGVATDLGIFDNFTTKETWKASTHDTIIGYYQWALKQKPLRGLSTTTPKDSTLAQRSASWMFNGKWERVWSNRLFTELNIGNFGYNFPEQPSIDYKSNPPRNDSKTGFNSGAGWEPFVLEREKPQIYGNATYYLPTQSAGSHDLKMGFEWIDDEANFAQNGTSGPLQYQDFDGQVDQILLTDEGAPDTLGQSWTVPSDRNRRVAIYFQDRWTASSHVTITAGVRYDRQRPYYIAAKRDPLLTGIFSAQTFPGKTILVRNNVAPRFGLSYDPAGDGRTAIKAFYGRYYYNFADSFSGLDPGGENTKTFAFLDPNGNRLYDGPQELGTLVSSSGGIDTRLDESIVTPHTDEFDLSYQRQFWGQSSFRLAYVRKMSRNTFGTYNLAREGQFTVPVVVPITLESYEGGVEGVKDFTVYDIPDSLAGVTDNIIATRPASVDNGAYTYDTLGFALNKRFAQGLFLDSSFDYTWRNDLRDDTSSNSPLTQSDPFGTDYYQNVYPTILNRQKTSTWAFHLSSRYELPAQVGIGANFQVQSGWQYARVITVRLPNSGRSRFHETNMGVPGRSDTVALLNIRLDKAFTFKGHRLTGMLDLFNILNANPIVNFNTANGSSYRQVNGVLDPRTLQIGIRFEF